MKNILKKFREKHNQSTKELSCYFGGNENLIIDWESESAEPTISECLILSKLYGVSLDEMFSDFDVKEVLPIDCVDSLGQQIRFNRMSARWYN